MKRETFVPDSVSHLVFGGLLLLLPTLPKGPRVFTEILSIKEVKITDLDVVKLRGCDSESAGI